MRADPRLLPRAGGLPEREGSSSARGGPRAGQAAAERGLGVGGHLVGVRTKVLPPYQYTKDVVAIEPLPSSQTMSLEGTEEEKTGDTGPR